MVFMFGIEAIPCAVVVAGNGVWVEVRVRVWVGAWTGAGF